VSVCDLLHDMSQGGNALRTTSAERMRLNILAWLRAQDAKIGRRSLIEETNAAGIDDDDELEPVEDGNAI
jgi:hypothetical protein